MSKPTNEVFAHCGAKLAYDRARTTFWCKVRSRPRPRPRQDDDRTNNINILDDDDGKRDDKPPQPCQQPPRWFLFCLAPNPGPQDALTDRKNIRILEYNLPEWSLLDCCRPECNRPDLFVVCFVFVCLCWAQSEILECLRTRQIIQGSCFTERMHKKTKEERANAA